MTGKNQDCGTEDTPPCKTAEQLAQEQAARDAEKERKKNKKFYDRIGEQGCTDCTSIDGSNRTSN